MNNATLIASRVACRQIGLVRELATKSSKKAGGGSRGSRGLGWLTRYREGRGGRHLQGRWFDRDVNALSHINDVVFNLGSKRAYLDLAIETQGVPIKNKRIVVELAEGALPVTVQNFVSLLQDEELGYKGTKITKVEKKVGICLQAAGLRCHPSISSTGIFDDEGFFISHTGQDLGIISMMSPGVHKNDSRIVITTNNSPQLDGKFVAFGRVIEDKDGVLTDIQQIFTKQGVPTQDVKVVGCGEL